MKRRVTRIAPWQAGKFFAVLYFIMGLIFAIPFGFFAQYLPGAAPSGFGIAFMIGVPIGYAIAGLILVPIMCWVFNLVAKLVGGLEFEVIEPEGV